MEMASCLRNPKAAGLPAWDARCTAGAQRRALVPVPAMGISVYQYAPATRAPSGPAGDPRIAKLEALPRALLLEHVSGAPVNRIFRHTSRTSKEPSERAAGRQQLREKGGRGG